MSACKKCSDCLFPDAAWNAEQLKAANVQPPDLPLDWRSQIVMPPPRSALAVECRYLHLLQRERPAKEQEIRVQASAVWRTVQAVLGPLPGHPDTEAVLVTLCSNLDMPIFYFKRLFARGRPSMCCDAVTPMFPEGDPFYPAHPAYPSGHSTQAHALAYFYAYLFPSLTDQLMDAAADVARNREVAGLHYPSDSLAGKLLAEQLVDMLFRSPSFRDAAKRAAAEWP